MIDKKGFLKGVIKYLCEDIRKLLIDIDNDIADSIEEIRLRAGKPVIIQNYDNEWFLEKNGQLVKETRNPYIPAQEEIIKTLELMSENSIYAFQDEIRNGFITLKGGHRVGIAGRVVLEGCSVKNIKDISGLNIRISKEVKGCAGKIIRFIIHKNQVLNTLIISPPQCGKTTMLRDIARILSNGCDEICFKGIKVGVVDERSEIGACYRGIPQNDLGIRTDVLDACPKSIGMIMMIRSMSPQVIITDEIGNKGDKDSILSVFNAGVKIITSAHGYNITEMKSRREILGLMEEKIFDRYIVLSNARGPGTLEEVVDGQTMETIYRGD
ncbi:MAG TPA: stage III sporulation protein AA [Clostridiaceae bacterium]|nr:stage III sporulation protein AA [Clostridiaceae bacterium]